MQNALVEERVEEGLAQQHAVREIFDPREGSGGVVESDRVPDHLAKGCASLRGDAAGEAHRGDAAGLRDADRLAVGKQTCLEEKLRELRGLAASSLADDDENGVRLDFFQEAVAAVPDRELLAVGEESLSRRLALVLAGHVTALLLLCDEGGGCGSGSCCGAVFQLLPEKESAADGSDKARSRWVGGLSRLHRVDAWGAPDACLFTPGSLSAFSISVRSLFHWRSRRSLFLLEQLLQVGVAGCQHPILPSQEEHAGPEGERARRQKGDLVHCKRMPAGVPHPRQLGNRYCRYWNTGAACVQMCKRRNGTSRTFAGTPGGQPSVISARRWRPSAPARVIMRRVIHPRWMERARLQRGGCDAFHSTTEDARDSRLRAITVE